MPEWELYKRMNVTEKCGEQERPRKFLILCMSPLFHKMTGILYSGTGTFGVTLQIDAQN